MAHEHDGIPERVPLSDAGKVARWNVLMRDDVMAITFHFTDRRTLSLTPEMIEDCDADFIAGVIARARAQRVDVMPEVARGCATKSNTNWEAQR